MWTVNIYARDFTYDRDTRVWVDEEYEYDDAYSFEDYESALAFAKEYSFSGVADNIWFDEEVDVPEFANDEFVYDVFSDNISDGTHIRVTIVEALN